MAEDWTKYQTDNKSDNNWSTYVHTTDNKPNENKEENKPGLLSQLWERVTKPTIELIPRNISEQVDEPSLDTTPNEARLKGFARGAMEGLSDTVSSLTSPLNLATAGFGTLEGLTGFNIARLGTKVLSAPVIAHGAMELPEHPFAGSVEIAGGLLGMGHGPSSKSKVKAIGDKIIEPPKPIETIIKDEAGRDLGVSDNTYTRPAGPWDTNTGVKEPIDLEGKVLDLARNKQGMGLPNPALTVDEVNQLFANPPKLKEGTTVNFGNKTKTPVKTEGPTVTSLKPATPELIAQAQSKGPDTINLKTADKTQLENAGMYGYKFEGINSNGSLRLRKMSILDEQNTRINPQTGEVFAGDSPEKVEFADGGNGGGPPDDGHIGDIVDRRKATVAQEIANLPRGLMAAWDLSAPFRQGLGMIHRPEWWKSWNGMIKSFGSEEAFRGLQQSIKDKPLFKEFNGQSSFAEKAGLKLTDLTDLNSREEQIMSTWAEKVPGIRNSNRAYTAFLNKLRADSFESLMQSAKVINQSTGEIDMNLAKELAEYVNTATGRGSLGQLERYAPALNSVFFSPRLIASRLQMLNPVYYMTANPAVRKEALKSLLAIAGTGQLITQLGKFAGGDVESDPTSSDFGKLKVGNTRIDPYGGFQQYIVAANRLLQGKTKSSVSGKTTELNSGKFGSPTRLDVASRFGESKLNPVINLATTILRGRNLSGQKVDLPEEVAQRFIPLFVQDLKNVITENPNLVPFHSDLGLEDADASRAPLVIPGAFGMGVQNYPSR